MDHAGLPEVRSPAYQFPFQLLGWLLGGPLTLQHQRLPNPGCDVLTTYCCPWETSSWEKGGEMGGGEANAIRTEQLWELKQCPGTRRVLGRLWHTAGGLGRGRLSAGRSGGTGGAAHPTD